MGPVVGGILEVELVKEVEPVIDGACKGWGIWWMFSVRVGFFER